MWTSVYYKLVCSSVALIISSVCVIPKNQVVVRIPAPIKSVSSIMLYDYMYCLP